MVKIKSYIYLTVQKLEIENIIQEMLHTWVIRDSTSSFASLIVTVKKKYGSLRLCMDYRQLNQLTINDRFLIPIIEELLDKLKHAQIFSNLDLQSGYYQVRMHKADIHKTSFKTYEEDYEFLVMPFGFTNAPSTFQALMNAISISSYEKHFWFSLMIFWFSQKI